MNVNWTQPRGRRRIRTELLLSLLTLVPTLAAPVSAAELREIGYLDVTTLGADPTGAKDSTAAIQKAVETARDAELVLFFPPGNYTISDTIQCLFESKAKACRLAGSTREAGRRAVIRLAPNSPGFGDPAKPKVVIHLRRANEGNADHYEQSIAGIDITIAEGNPGAVGVRLQGAENTHVEDMTIDLSRGGYVGLWGPPGSGGSTHKLRIVGGQIGVNTFDARAIPGVEGKYAQNSQPVPVLSGIVLENQSGYAVTADTRGPLVLVGCRIVRQVEGPVMVMRGKYEGDALSGQINLVDSIIEHANFSEKNTIVAMEKSGRSFLMVNCYVRNAKQIFAPEAPANPAGWLHVRHLGYAQGTLPHGLIETPYRDGSPVSGNLLFDNGGEEAPPADLIGRHTWGDSFCGFETPGAIDVRRAHGAKGDGQTDDTQAIQAAIDAGEVVFVPKGTYAISRTLRLKKNTKLVGVHSSLSRIVTIDRPKQRFAGAEQSDAGIPMLQMPDAPEGDVVIASLHIGCTWPIAQHHPAAIQSYAIAWRCKALLRDCHVQPNKQINYHPAQVLKVHYKDRDYPDNGKYPAQMKYDVLPFSWPLVQASGHAEGRWYNFFLHGDHYEKPQGRLIKIDGTKNPISIYHFHCQHNQGAYYLEAVGARHVSVYGSKSEGMYGIASFKDCDQIRYIGHGGIGSPAPDNPLGIEWFFRFENVPHFVFGGHAPQLAGKGGRFISHQAPYHVWYSGSHGQSFALRDLQEGKSRSKLEKLCAPILYLRG